MKETPQTSAPLTATAMPSAPFVPAPEAVTATPAPVQTQAADVPPTPPAEPIVMPAAAVETPQPRQPAAVAATPAPAPVKLDWPSDLQQVETSRDRLQAAAQNADDGAPRRIKRVRPKVEHVSSEPLQQVETRH